MNLETGNEIERMLEHWQSTPENGYLGSSYGFPHLTIQDLMCGDALTIVRNKLIEDIPVLRRYTIDVEIQNKQYRLILKFR